MVFVKHRLWVHVLEVFEMVPWIQHRDVVVDELEGVAIAREHQCLVPRLLTHGGQGGDHVITLVPRCSTYRTPNASNACWMSGNWLSSSCGAASRVPLY